MVRILVPVDFSKTSVNALRYAMALFQGSQLEITILHIYGVESTALMMKSIDRILIENAEDQLKGLIEELKQESSQVTFKTRLAKNYAVSTISDMGDTGTYDFIVMGTKGVSGLKEVFMGSVAGGVISSTKAPVIVVPLDYKFNDFNHIVFAVGDDSISNDSVLHPLVQLVDSHDAKLEVLHISDNGAPDFQKMLSSILRLDPEFNHKKGTGDLNQQLNVHLQNHETDLLCLLRTKKDFLDRLFSGSVTLKQTFNSSVPLLILHN